MFSEPQSVTISGTAHTLPRVFSDQATSKYRKDDGSIVFEVSHQQGKRLRAAAALVHSKYAADPLYPAQNVPYSLTVRFIVDRPLVGYSVAEQKAVVDGFLANLQATTGANITKLLGGES